MKRIGHRQLSFERLERREMKTASATLANGVLTVQGTDHPDHIVISSVPVGRTQKIQVTVNDLQTGEVLQTVFNEADVSKILVHGYGGDDVIENNTAKPSEMYGDFGSDVVAGGSGADKLYGATTAGGPDTGNNTLYGHNGDDTLYGSEQADQINGGAGADYVYGYKGSDELWGGDGDDQVYGNDANGGADGENILHGGAGNDFLMGADNVDHISGDAGDDVIRGLGGNDVLWGGTATADGSQLSNSGKDTIWGDDGDDSLYGGDGDDRLHGNAGNDALLGGEGNDFLAGGADADIIVDDSGTNTIYFDLLDQVFTAHKHLNGYTDYWFAPKVVEGPYQGYASFTG